MSLVAMALTECSAPPPADGAVHLANGVALRVAEDLMTSTRGANPTPYSPNLDRGAGASGESASR
jgi:hypothetical protein